MSSVMFWVWEMYIFLFVWKSPKYRISAIFYSSEEFIFQRNPRHIIIDAILLLFSSPIIEWYFFPYQIQIMSFLSHPICHLDRTLQHYANEEEDTDRQSNNNGYSHETPTDYSYCFLVARILTTCFDKKGVISHTIRHSIYIW